MKIDDMHRAGMGRPASSRRASPDNYGRATFDLVADGRAKSAATAAALQSNALLTRAVDRLTRIEAVTMRGVGASGSSALRTSLNR